MIFNCHICGLKKETKGERNRVPKSWKRAFDAIWCQKCWNRAYVLRAVTIPIAGPLDPAEWPEFRVALREQWVQSTSLANWANDEMYLRDARRGAQEKCPPQPRTYLYPEARQAFPEIPGQTTAAVLQAAQGKYAATRYQILWTRERTLATHRYPSPFVVPGAGWTLAYRDQRPTIEARIGDRRWTLRLRGGHEFRRQLSDLRAIASGDAVQGELAILRVRAKKSDDHNGISDHGDFSSARWRIMAKVVGWFPRRPVGDLSGCLRVHTSAESLLVAVDEKDERIWTENADHVRLWIAEYERKRHRWSQDMKAEQRPVPSFAARREAATMKQRNRMASAINEITAHVANFAARRKFAEVRYDDGDKSFAPSFPWYILKETMKRKITERGIKFVASAEVAQEATEDAREDSDT